MWGAWLAGGVRVCVEGVLGPQGVVGLTWNACGRQGTEGLRWGHVSPTGDRQRPRAGPEGDLGCALGVRGAYRGDVGCVWLAGDAVRALGARQAHEGHLGDMGSHSESENHSENETHSQNDESL